MFICPSVVAIAYAVHCHGKGSTKYNRRGNYIPVFCLMPSHHLLKPVPDEDDAFPQDGHVEGFRGVRRLVVLHGDAGGEEDGGDAVADEYALVGEIVEDAGEVPAAVI